MLQSMGLQRVRHDLATEQQQGFPGGTGGKGPSCQCERHKRCRFETWIGNIPWRRAWQPTPVFLSGASLGHELRSLKGEASFVATNSSDARRRRLLYAKTLNLLGRIGPLPAPALAYKRCERRGWIRKGVDCP